MTLKDVRNWLLSLASASALTQMVFAQAGPQQQIIVLTQDKTPAATTPPVTTAPMTTAPMTTAPMTTAPTVVPSNGGTVPENDTGIVPNSYAGNGGDSASSEEGPWRLFGDKDFCGFTVTGWVYGTGVYNSSNSGDTRYNGPLTMSDQEGIFLNQFYVSISRALKEEFSWGATIDTFWGNDYNASQSRGWEAENARGLVQKWNTGQDYGIAAPQQYVEVGSTKYSVKVGHFWTPIGFMVVQGPGNFFNTQPYGFMATNPFTHWGALGTANLTDDFWVQFGVVNGWDALDRPANVASYLFGGRWTYNKEKNGYVQAHCIIGKEPQNLDTEYGSRTLINAYTGYDITDKVSFVYESNLGWQANNQFGTSTFYNFHPFLFYKINDCWKAGIRYEYFHDPSGFMAGIRGGNPNVGPYNGNNQTIALGLNWSPNASKNLTIRPEYRYDHFSGNGLPYNAGNSTAQNMFIIGGFYIF